MNAVIVIPVFNEASTIGAVVAAARRHAPVIVIDDGSADSSGAIARAAGAEIVCHPRRLGKGTALQSGIEAARQRQAAAVITLDGDGQHDAGEIPRLVEAARRAPGAIVIGSRLEGIGDMAVARAHATRMAAFFMSWGTGLPALDTQSGFRIYPLALCEKLRPRAAGFVWETEILARAAALGVEVVAVPVTVIPRAALRSRFRPLADGAAIGAYLGRTVTARWREELAAAAYETRQIFDRDRLRLRHAEMWSAALTAPAPLWGPALTRVALRRASGRLLSWWRHPRRRRATVAAWATLAAPGTLALLALQSAGGERMPDLAGPLIRRLYDARRLRSAEARPAVDDEVAPAVLPSAVTFR